MSERNSARHAELLAAAARAALVELRIPLEQKQLPPLSRAALHLLEIAVELYEESRRSLAPGFTKAGDDDEETTAIAPSAHLGPDGDDGSGGGT